MTHISDLAAEHSAAASAERARDRAGAWVPDDPRRPEVWAEEPDEPREFCSICEWGHGGHVCRWCIAAGLTPNNHRETA